MPLQDADTDAKTGAESLCAKKIPRTKVTHKVNRALAAKTLSRPLRSGPIQHPTQSPQHWECFISTDETCSVTWASSMRE